MEEDLDKIAEGNAVWNEVLDEFYKYNISAVTFASKSYPEKLKNTFKTVKKIKD